MEVSEWNLNINTQNFCLISNNITCMSITAGESWLGEFLVISVVERAGRFTGLSTSGCGLLWLFMCLGGYLYVKQSTGSCGTGV